jgi:dihydrofolate reductase
MRKIILGLAVSLDGFIEGPNGEIDWCLTDQDYGMSEFLKRIDTLFMGRKTYELTKKMGGTGFNSMKEYIFSNTLNEMERGKSIIKGNIEKEVMRIKNEMGKDIWLFGGASLTCAMMNLQLVDEIWLSVHPVILGGGKPVFPDISRRVQLHLIDTATYSTGLVSCRYEVKR